VAGNLAVPTHQNEKAVPTAKETGIPRCGREILFSEGDKVYDEARLSVCGMVGKSTRFNSRENNVHLSMHPEIIQEGGFLSDMRNGFSTYGTYESEDNKTLS
jgi:hypothetical protein